MALPLHVVVVWRCPPLSLLLINKPQDVPQDCLFALYCIIVNRIVPKLLKNKCGIGRALQLRVNKMSPLSSNEDEERKVRWDEGKEHGEGVLKEEAQEENKEDSEDEDSVEKVKELNEIAEFFKNVPKEKRQDFLYGMCTDGYDGAALELNPFTSLLHLTTTINTSTMSKKKLQTVTTKLTMQHMLRSNEMLQMQKQVPN